jgi:hypothetical protein
MAYRFTPFSSKKKVIVAPAPDITSTDAFPTLRSGSCSRACGSMIPITATKLDFKKAATVVAPTINKITPQAVKIKPATAASVSPSSKVVTHCYDEFGEDYNGPDEEADEEVDVEFNADLPVGGRRGAW